MTSGVVRKCLEPPLSITSQRRSGSVSDEFRTRIRDASGDQARRTPGLQQSMTGPMATGVDPGGEERKILRAGLPLPSLWPLSARVLPSGEMAGDRKRYFGSNCKITGSPPARATERIVN